MMPRPNIESDRYVLNVFDTVTKRHTPITMDFE